MSWGAFSDWWDRPIMDAPPQPVPQIPEDINSVTGRGRHIIKEIIGTEISFVNNAHVYKILLEKLIASGMLGFKAGLQDNVGRVVAVYGEITSAHTALIADLNAYLDNNADWSDFFNVFVDLAMPIYVDDIIKIKSITKDIMGVDIGLVSTVYTPDPYGYVKTIHGSRQFADMHRETRQAAGPVPIVSIDLLVIQRMLKFPLFMKDAVKEKSGMIVTTATQDRLTSTTRAFNDDFNSFMTAWLCYKLNKACEDPADCPGVTCGHSVEITTGTSCPCVCNRRPGSPMAQQRGDRRK